MNNLSRHKTVSDLSQEGSADQENVDLTVTSPDISDPRIFMITKAISRSLQSSFNGLENTLGSLSKDIHKLASDSSSKHTLRAFLTEPCLFVVKTCQIPGRCLNIHFHTQKCLLESRCDDLAIKTCQFIGRWLPSLHSGGWGFSRGSG